jgi:nucleoside permease NupC
MYIVLPGPSLYPLHDLLQSIKEFLKSLVQVLKVVIASILAFVGLRYLVDNIIKGLTRCMRQRVRHAVESSYSEYLQADI